MPPKNHKTLQKNVKCSYFYLFFLKKNNNKDKQSLLSFLDVMNGVYFHCKIFNLTIVIYYLKNKSIITISLKYKQSHKITNLVIPICFLNDEYA